MKMVTLWVSRACPLHPLKRFDRLYVPTTPSTHAFSLPFRGLARKLLCTLRDSLGTILWIGALPMLSLTVPWYGSNSLLRPPLAHFHNLASFAPFPWLLGPQPDGDVKRVPYRIVETLAYTSQRKMMSVLVRDPEGKYFLYAKGAGSKIYSRLASSVPQDVKDKTEQCIEDWSTDAFRCLAFAYREVPKEEAEAWLDKLGEARSDPAAAVSAAWFPCMRDDCA